VISGQRKQWFRTQIFPGMVIHAKGRFYSRSNRTIELKIFESDSRPLITIRTTKTSLSVLSGSEEKRSYVYCSFDSNLFNLRIVIQENSLVFFTDAIQCGVLLFKDAWASWPMAKELFESTYTAVTVDGAMELERLDWSGRKGLYPTTFVANLEMGATNFMNGIEIVVLHSE
jgi:hypothetical protein